MFSCRYIITTLIILSSIVFLSQQTVRAADREGLGIGVILGEPTGVSIKYNNFPILGIAWSIDNHFHVHCDYWAHHAVLDGPVNWYAGIGGKMKVYRSDSKGRPKDDDSRFGAGLRIPVGLQYYITDQLELFGEVVPGISLIPETSFDLDAGIGLRYYF